MLKIGSMLQSPDEYIKEQYKKDIYDEFIEPTSFNNYQRYRRK